MTDTAPRPLARPVDPDALALLEDERRFLLRSIADLEREHAAGDLDNADYLELKDGYTARAAAVLRAIEDGRSRLPASPTRARRGRVVVGLAVAVLAAVVAGLLIGRASDPRLDGESATGDIAESTGQLLSEARLKQASDPLGAIKDYDKVLATDPDNVEALTYRGWLLMISSADLVDDGEAYLDRALAADPTYPDAHAFKGVVLFNVHGDAAGAVAQFEAFLANDPPPSIRSLVEPILDAARAAVAAPPTTVAPG